MQNNNRNKQVVPFCPTAINIFKTIKSNIAENINCDGTNEFNTLGTKFTVGNQGSHKC